MSRAYNVLKIKILEKKVTCCKRDFAKFVESLKALNLFSSNSRPASNKFGFGYDFRGRKHLHKHVKLSCSRCGNYRHESVICKLKRQSPRTNKKGPKKYGYQKKLLFLLQVR